LEEKVELRDYFQKMYQLVESRLEKCIFAENIVWKNVKKKD